VKYFSTRGHAARPEFCDILLGGLAPDGGLYLPESIPAIHRAELDAWRRLSYAELAFEILSKFATDIPPDDLRDICTRTYTADAFRYARAGDDPARIAPLHWLEPGKLSLLALSNGPTLAFKDMSMQALGNLFEYVLEKRGETINILGATSGDTGSAAEYAMRGKHRVKVFMLSPHGKMSAFQRAQMYSLADENIFNIAITGMFDDAQDIVKAVSNDAAFKAQHCIGAVNSINWGRVAAQVVYYFHGYFAATSDNAQQVAFCVPTGNFGNIFSGYIARCMGLPIARLILTTNENDVLDEFFRTGIYRPRKAVETRVTSSPSMDVSKASNFERFIFDLVGRDPATVAGLWKEVDSGGAFDLSRTPFFARLSEFGFVSGKSTHADRLETIREVYSRYGVMIDTHTADGVKVAWQYAGGLPADVPLLVLETAQAAKFADTLREALGRAPEIPADLQELEALPQRVEVMPPSVEAVKAFIVARI
jgi:threonine synthase